MIDDVLGYINYGFAGLFFLEAILKMISYGFVPYFRDKENIFDVVIVLASILTIVISLCTDLDLGASGNFIRALRLFRILKYF